MLVTLVFAFASCEFIPLDSFGTTGSVDQGGGDTNTNTDVEAPDENEDVDDTQEPALDPNCKHQWVKTKVEQPFCGSGNVGSTTYTCEKCNGTKEELLYGRSSHDLEIIVKRQVTCEVAGLESEKCKICSYSRDKVIPSPAHTTKLMKVPNEENKFAVMCPYCLKIDNYVDALRYEDYGAKGDGVTDDSEAIRATHNAANEIGIKVLGNPNATYYIGPISSTIYIKTDTDWNGAKFIFGDDQIHWNNSALRGVHVFTVTEQEYSYTVSLSDTYKIQKGQTNLGITFDAPCMVKIENSHEKIFIRYGENANSGAKQHEFILVDENGNVDPSTPIQYDYFTVTEMRVYYNDDPISVGNAHITTIVPDPKAQDADYENNYCFYYRGINVTRSNTTIYNIQHSIVGEQMTIKIDRDGDGRIEEYDDDKSYGVPYNGFFSFNRCANVTMKDCLVQGHQAYSFWQVSGNSKARNEMGSYDIYATDCVNLSLVNITQYENKETGEVITNRFMYHGIMGTNFCRNMVVDNCYIDRFDAHQGLHNARITNSTIGFGILVIGGGELYIENVYRIGNDAGNDAFILLRHDYNSVFDGDLIIKNCKMGKNVSYLITGVWREFYKGLPNHMFNSITIDGLVVEGRNTLSIYGVSGAFEDVVDNKVNKLYLPTSITVSGVVGTTGRPVTVKASQTEDAFATVPVTKK